MPAQPVSEGGTASARVVSLAMVWLGGSEAARERAHGTLAGGLGHRRCSVGSGAGAPGATGSSWAGDDLRSGAVVCPASSSGRQRPRAWMAMRGSGPDRVGGRERLLTPIPAAPLPSR